MEIRTILVAAVAAACMLAIAGCGGGGGASPATIEGTVLDDGTLEPVAGAQVTVGNASTTTSASGTFSLATTSGARSIAVDAAGYEELTLNLSLNPGVNARGNIFLAPEMSAGRGAVSGIVTRSGQPAGGASILSGTASATAKPDGSYTVYNLPSGTRAITAISADGTATGSATANVQAGQVTTGVNVSLSLAPPPPPVL